MPFLVRLGMYRLSRDVRARWQVVVLIGAFLALGSQRVIGETPAPPPQPASPVLKVGFLNGLLSIQAKDAPWGKVLDEVRTKTGIFLRVSMPLEGSVTVSFKNLPGEEALRRLFGPDASFAILYSDRKPGAASAAVPSEVWVLGKGSAASSETPHGGQEVASSVREGMNDSVQAIEQEFDRSPRAALDAAIESRNQELRLKAIAHLGQHPNNEGVGVLLKFAQDRDPHIRQSARAALGAMAQKEPQARAIVAQELEAARSSPEMWQWAAETLGVSVEPSDDEAQGQETPEGDTAQERTK